MAKQSSVNLDITNNADGFDISGGTTARKLGITGGDVTIAGSGSATVTFPTTSTTIAGLGITQSFSALQTFTAGISAAGGVTFTGIFSGVTASFTGLVSSTVGFSGAGTNLIGNATGLTVGTATSVNVTTDNSATSYYLVFVGGTASGGKTLGIDSTIGPLSYVPSTSTLTLSNIAVSGTVGTINTQYTGNSLNVDSIAGNGSGVGIDGGGGNAIISDTFGGTVFVDCTTVIIGDNSTVGNGRVMTINDNTGAVDFGNMVLSNVGSSSQLVTSFNGINGAVTGVSKINGLSGGVTFAAGTGITFTSSAGTITFSSTSSGGGFARSINSFTTSTSAGSTASTDYVYICGSTGNINLTMPTAVSNTNRYSIKQNSIGTLTIITTSSQTIDGVTGFVMSKQYQSIDLLSDNSNWIVS